MTMNDMWASFDAIKARILKSCEQAEPSIMRAAERFADKTRGDWDRHERSFDAASKRVTESLKNRRNLRKTNEDTI